MEGLPPKTDPDEAVLREVPKTDPEELLADCVDNPPNIDAVGGLESVIDPSAEDVSSFIPPEEIILVDPPKTDPVDAVSPSTEVGLEDPLNIEAEEDGGVGKT